MKPWNSCQLGNLDDYRISRLPGGYHVGRQPPYLFF
jgi:hypothetical protein